MIRKIWEAIRGDDKSLVKIGVRVGLAGLFLFVVFGFLAPGFTMERMTPADWVPLTAIISNGMMVFLSYEGFELICYDRDDMDDRREEEHRTQRDVDRVPEREDPFEDRELDRATLGREMLAERAPDRAAAESRVGLPREGTDRSDAGEPGPGPEPERARHAERKGKRPEGERFEACEPRLDRRDLLDQGFDRRELLPCVAPQRVDRPSRPREAAVEATVDEATPDAAPRHGQHAGHRDGGIHRFGPEGRVVEDRRRPDQAEDQMDLEPGREGSGLAQKARTFADRVAEEERHAGQAERAERVAQAVVRGERQRVGMRPAPADEQEARGADHAMRGGQRPTRRGARRRRRRSRR